MSRLRLLAIVPMLAFGLAGCVNEVGVFPGRSPAPPTVIPNEQAAPIPAGADAMAGLEQRPIRPPVLAPDAKCPASASVDNGSVAPNYGQGVGPLYLAGQDAWYSAGEVAILMVDSTYSGPLVVRGFQLRGAQSTVNLADMPPAEVPVYKESQHGVAVVQAVHGAGGGLELQAVPPSRFWRAWFGVLSTDGPGCFGLQVDGDLFTEFIVFPVLAGKPPPG